MSSLVCFDFAFIGFWKGSTFRFFLGDINSFSTRAFSFPSTLTTLLSRLGEAPCAKSMSLLPSDSSLETVSWRNCSYSKYLQTGTFDDPAPDLCLSWDF